MSDPTLQRDVMQALADNPLVHPDEISAQVVDGDVTLHGTVASPVQRDQAAEATRTVPGIRDIDNQLRVHPLGYHRHVDADTAAAVMDALVADPELHADTALEVECHEGVVSLRGDVADPEQRERAERIALAVPGVSHVHNHLNAPDR